MNLGCGGRRRWNVFALTLALSATATASPFRYERAVTPGATGTNRLEVDLPLLCGAAPDLRDLRLYTSEGREVPYRLESATTATPLRANVRFRARPSERGRSRYRIDLPAGGLPITGVEIRVRAADASREVTVTEPRLKDDEVVPFPLGSAAGVLIPISRPESRELEITVDEGVKGPLAIESIALRLAAQPSILFEYSDSAPLVARYGAPSLDRPEYDVEAGAELRSTMVHRAKWAGSPKPVSRTEPVQTPVILGGVPIDRQRYRFSRHIGSAPRGVAVLPLDADVLARSTNLADVRLIDRKNRQVPYVVERRAPPVVVLLQIQRHTEPKRNVSVYRMMLPYHRMPEGATLVLTTSATGFERNVELSMSSNGQRLSASTWRSDKSADVAPPLVFNLPRDVDSVEVSIDEGNNAPLPITSAEVHLPAYALRFYSPGSRLDLVYGDPGAPAPRYDLALLTPKLFSEPAMEIGFISPPPFGTPPDVTRERKFFWIAIAAVALLLVVLVARLLAPLVREEPRPLG